MGMAIAHSREGVGLTTIGVGVQFGAELATKIGSVRGGNLYFIRDEPDVKQLFTGQLDYMVSELAHDLTLTITPRAGLKIAGVYGIPGELLGWQNDREIKVTIPTVFLDNHGGGIFFTLAPEAADSFLPEKSAAGALADVAVSYLPIGAARPDSHAISIAARDTVSDGMKLGALLIDEFTVLHEATSAHYLRNDQETAFQLVDGFKQRLDASPIGGLDDEKKLIDSMRERSRSSRVTAAKRRESHRSPSSGAAGQSRASMAASTSSAVKRSNSLPTTTWFAAVMRTTRSISPTTSRSICPSRSWCSTIRSRATR
jgi:Ca-activated chloride channel family protein